ncbi:hypothetical protein AHAT_40530 [Agarivorans sp. Toyoura001]|nr:hypothetical protein AHAT_40530 [Agarivorans sp. Toyoura001]
MRWESLGAIEENTAKEIKGRAVINPACDAVSDKLSITCSNTGAKLVKGARKLRATKNTPNSVINVDGVKRGMTA